MCDRVVTDRYFQLEHHFACGNLHNIYAFTVPKNHHISVQVYRKTIGDRLRKANDKVFVYSSIWTDSQTRSWLAGKKGDEALHGYMNVRGCRLSNV